MTVLKWDGHTHTKFCYHGSWAETTAYLERAIEQGFTRYTLSEHPPLPEQYVDNKRLWTELAMPESELPAYFAYAKAMKEEYKGRIDVTIGLEMDYLDGQQEFSNQILEPWLSELEDVVISVHYLPGKGGTRCIDFTPDDFKDAFMEHYGSIEKIIDAYYDQVEAAIAWASTLPSGLRKRIGHINLIRKFQSELPPMDEEQIRRRLLAILPKLREAGLGLDVNVAGFRKPTCGEAYVPPWFMKLCVEQGVELIYGSDSHSPADVGAEWEWYEEQIRTLSV